MPINALTAGVAALAINSTAFTIEIFRGGFAAVPVAQHDAARALGLRPALIMALVVVPQVFRIVLPPLGNQIVSVVLGSAQASIIGVAELTQSCRGAITPQRCGKEYRLAAATRHRLFGTHHLVAPLLLAPHSTQTKCQLRSYF